MSQYARALPAILADMERQHEEDETQRPPQQQDGAGNWDGEEIVIHRYPVEGGGVVLSSVPLEEDQPPTVESDPPAPAHQPTRKEPPFCVIVLFLISILALLFLIAIGVLTPSQQPEQRALLRVPAVLLPIKSFTTTVTVIPTGKKTHPATPAQGVLTITNGSILSEDLPKGMILTSTTGTEVATDAAVFIPPGSATGYGVATVSAHAVIPGASGNIPPLAIDQVEGTALYIRNLYPFTGGHNAFTTSFITSTDEAFALSVARTRLKAHTVAGILLHPCAEAVTGNQIITVTWQCQFATYHIPASLRVIGIRVHGSYLLITVVFVARPHRLETK